MHVVINPMHVNLSNPPPPKKKFLRTITAEKVFANYEVTIR
jgi:hypothetical protein